MLFLFTLSFACILWLPIIKLSKEYFVIYLELVLMVFLIIVHLVLYLLLLSLMLLLATVGILSVYGKVIVSD